MFGSLSSMSPASIHECCVYTGQRHAPCEAQDISSFNSSTTSNTFSDNDKDLGYCAESEDWGLDDGDSLVDGLTMELIELSPKKKQPQQQQPSTRAPLTPSTRYKDEDNKVFLARELGKLPMKLDDEFFSLSGFPSAETESSDMRCLDDNTAAFGSGNSIPWSALVADNNNPSPCSQSKFRENFTPGSDHLYQAVPTTSSELKEDATPAAGPILHFGISEKIARDIFAQLRSTATNLAQHQQDIQITISHNMRFESELGYTCMLDCTNGTATLTSHTHLVCDLGAFCKWLVEGLVWCGDTTTTSQGESVSYSRLYQQITFKGKASPVQLEKKERGAVRSAPNKMRIPKGMETIKATTSPVKAETPVTPRPGTLRTTVKRKLTPASKKVRGYDEWLASRAKTKTSSPTTTTTHSASSKGSRSRPVGTAKDTLRMRALKV